MIERKLTNGRVGLEKVKPVYRDFRVGDVRHSKASIDKAKELLGYRPAYKISEGLDKTVDWYINQYYNERLKQ